MTSTPNAAADSACARVVSMAPRATEPFNDGLYFELQSIAMVVVGGTSLLGGSGGIGRTLIGGLILTVLYALFIQAGWPTQTQLIANGVIVAAAVILQGGLARQ